MKKLKLFALAVVALMGVTGSSKRSRRYDVSSR